MSLYEEMQVRFLAARMEREMPSQEVDQALLSTHKVFLLCGEENALLQPLSLVWRAARESGKAMVPIPTRMGDFPIRGLGYLLKLPVRERRLLVQQVETTEHRLKLMMQTTTMEQGPLLHLLRDALLVLDTILLVVSQRRRYAEKEADSASRQDALTRHPADVYSQSVRETSLLENEDTE